MLWFWVIIRYFSFSEDTIFCQFFPRNFPNDSVFTASGATPQNNAVISFSYSLIVPTEIVMFFFLFAKWLKHRWDPEPDKNLCHSICLSSITNSPKHFFRFHSFFIIFCCNQIEWQWPSNSIHYPSDALRFNFHLFSL